MEYNQFTDIYTDVNRILNEEYKMVLELLDDCLFVFDTNVLLLPYTDRGKVVSETKAIFEKLCCEDKAYFPAQVIKEFAKNRFDKLKEIIKEIGDYKSQISIKEIPDKRRVLCELVQYNEIKEEYEKLKNEMDNYKRKVEDLENILRDNFFEDPITQIYKDFIKPNMIRDIAKNIKELKEESKSRYQYKIPPGYKDGSKDDKGIGDYVIWQEILELGKEKNKNVVFVTGEEKTDWCIRASGNVFYPRFELCYEFKKITGFDFGIIQFGQLYNYLFEQEKEKEKSEDKRNTITGWQLDEKDWYYNNKGGEHELNSWKKSGDSWFYLNQDGYIARDELIQEGNNYKYVDATGKMVQNSFCTVEGNKMYFGHNGNAVLNGELVINSSKYCFENGIVIREETE